jgi:hypothetical protein
VIQPRLPPRQPHPHVAVRVRARWARTVPQPDELTGAACRRVPIPKQTHDRPAVVLVRPLRAAIPGGKRTQVSRAGTLRFVVRLLSSCGSLDAWSF